MCNATRRDPRRAHSVRRSACRVVLRPIVLASILANVLTSVVSTHPLAAQASGTSTTLGDVLRIVERSSPRAAAARAVARAAAARAPLATLPADPSLQLGLMNYDVATLRPMAPLGMAQVQLMQMVQTGGKRGLAGRVADAEAIAASQRASDVAWDVRANAAMLFHELRAADGSLDAARESLLFLQNIASAVRAMYQVGQARQTDVLRAQVELARMAEDTIRMHAMRAATAARLAAFVDTATLTLDVLAAPAFPAEIPTVDSLQLIAQTGRPMIRAGVAGVDAADASIVLARREAMPDLQFGVQYGQRAGGAERMGSVMIGGSLPIFARRRQARMREEAEAMHAMASADLAAMRADTRALVAATHADLSRARSLAALYRRTILPQAEATAASALTAYRVGGVDFMTVLDDQLAVNAFRRELITLDAEEGKAWAELEMLVGRALFDPDVTTGGVARAASHGGVR